MPNYKFLLGAVLVVLSLLFTGCGGGGGSSSGGSPGTNPGSSTVTIQGDLSNGSHAQNLLFRRFLATIFPSPAFALDKNRVSKVIAFSCTKRFTTANVVNGKFSLNVNTGSPIGLIFVGTSNEFLGYLKLSNGFDSIPLTNLRSGVTTIDLQTLSSSGLIVEPSHNPLGNELVLTSEEQTALGRMGTVFSSIVKNPDVDGNGVIDILENKFFRPFVMYFVTGGTFAGGLTPTVSAPAGITGYRFCFDATDTNRPNNVTFTGPAGSGLYNSPASTVNVVDASSSTYFGPYVTNPTIPPAGHYTVGYKTGTLDFSIGDQSSAPQEVVLAIPTVTLNANGTINKVSWNYRLGNGSSSNLTPQSIINALEVQIDGAGTPCASYAQQGRIYNSGNLSATTTEHVLTCQNLSWSNVNRMYMAYNDAYGNHYVVSFTVTAPPASSIVNQALNNASNNLNLKEGDVYWDGIKEHGIWADSTWTYCARFARMCLGEFNPLYQTAIDMYNHYNAQGAINTSSTPPRGAAIFYDSHSENGNAGHVCLADGNGQCYSPVTITTGIVLRNVAGYFHAPYLGYVTASDFKTYYSR